MRYPATVSLDEIRSPEVQRAIRMRSTEHLPDGTMKTLLDAQFSTHAGPRLLGYINPDDLDDPAGGVMVTASRKEGRPDVFRAYTLPVFCWWPAV